MMNLNAGIWSETSKRSGGAIQIGDCDVRVLAREFGTPLFVLDEKDLRNRIASWKSEHARAFTTHAGSIYYAAKAFISVELAKIINESGISLDVCTGGELAVARAAGFPGAKIEMHGNNKSEAEISAAMDYGVGTIVLDSLQEIERVNRIATRKGVKQRVMIRLTPGVEAHTHESIKTAHEDVKFGFSIASGAAWEAVTTILKNSSNIELIGVHSHIGSQIFATDGFEVTAQRLIGFVARCKKEFNIELSELCIGGGYGVAYVEGDDPISASEFLSTLASVIDSECRKNSINHPRVSIEPGRAIIGPAMITVYEVGTTKDVTLEDGGHRNYISIDGGMSDNIRPSLYGAQYSVVLANRESSAPLIQSRVVGKHCETGDIVIHDVKLPSDITPGDLLAVPVTGAYGRSMASNYNHVPRPAVISVSDGAARTILRRENEADLLALDVVEKARQINSGQINSMKADTPTKSEGGR